MKIRTKTQLTRETPLVFMGGTCADSNWRSILIEKCKSSKIDLFNPVVKDWNEDAKLREEEVKRTADILLFVITPRSHSKFSIAEVVENAINNPLKTVYCFLNEDTTEWSSTTGYQTFPKNEINSLNEIGKTIEKYGATWAANLDEVVEIFNTWELRVEAANQTIDHMNRVNSLCDQMANMLQQRGDCHDNSKMEGPEWPLFRENTILLRDITYGTDEYKEALKKIKPALDHHYSHNSHHPEFYEDGLNDMCLLDLMEMLCDWKAATERHADGDLMKSLEINSKRFNISPQLTKIFDNTIKKYL